MEDKKVGEIWLALDELERQGGPSAMIADVGKELIRKLVEERKAQYYLHFSLSQAEAMSFRDFGIDPETFK